MLTGCEKEKALKSVCVDVPEFRSLQAEFITGANLVENVPYGSSEEILFLTLASSSEEFGVKFSATVEVPDCSQQYYGWFQWVQLVKVKHTREFSDGHEEYMGAGFGAEAPWMLDSQFPYDESEVAGPGLWVGETGDAPGTPLDLTEKDPKDHGELVQVSRKGKYTMFLLWSPFPGDMSSQELVSLGYVAWHFEATVERDTFSHQWTIVYESPGAGTIAIGQETSDLPTWSGNVKELRWTSMN